MTPRARSLLAQSGGQTRGTRNQGRARTRLGTSRCVIKHQGPNDKLSHAELAALECNGGAIEALAGAACWRFHEVVGSPIAQMTAPATTNKRCAIMKTGMDSTTATPIRCMTVPSRKMGLAVMQERMQQSKTPTVRRTVSQGRNKSRAEL